MNGIEKDLTARCTDEISPGNKPTPLCDEHHALEHLLQVKSSAQHVPFKVQVNSVSAEQILHIQQDLKMKTYSEGNHLKFKAYIYSDLINVHDIDRCIKTLSPADVLSLSTTRVKAPPDDKCCVELVTLSRPPALGQVCEFSKLYQHFHDALTSLSPASSGDISPHVRPSYVWRDGVDMSGYDVDKCFIREVYPHLLNETSLTLYNVTDASQVKDIFTCAEKTLTSYEIKHQMLLSVMMMKLKNYWAENPPENTSREAVISAFNQHPKLLCMSDYVVQKSGYKNKASVLSEDKNKRHLC